MKYLVIIGCIFYWLATGHVAQAQSPRDTLANHYLEIAKGKVEEKKYAEAQEIFKKIFSLKATVPDELAYFYGVTLLNLKKYSQSRTALNKYLDLQGKDGPLSHKAEEALIRVDCEETGYRDAYMVCDVCYGDSIQEITCRICKGKGIEMCPTCKGSGVSTSTNSFGTSYHTCNRCAGEKIIRCTTCKGERKEKIVCYNCHGKGHLRIRRKCY
jgi:DnaJ-class molecular chaperone